MNTYNVKMEGSEQERQLLEVLRDYSVDVRFIPSAILLLDEQSEVSSLNVEPVPREVLSSSWGAIDKVTIAGKK
jgi:hypothetical protein